MIKATSSCLAECATVLPKEVMPDKFSKARSTGQVFRVTRPCLSDVEKEI